MSDVRVCVMTGHGINADLELVSAFTSAGGVVSRVHVADLIEADDPLAPYDIAAVPGGFSFGDHLGSGLALASLLRHHLGGALGEHIENGGLVIGICNGFQVLTKMGIIPDFEGDCVPSVSLVHNSTGVFEDRWTRLRFEPESRCVWTRGLGELELPIRNGEGRFIGRDEQTLDRLETEGYVAVRYEGSNPNGSARSIAGITDGTGRVLGLMPHPEAYLCRENHPRVQRGEGADGEGIEMLRLGVEYVRRNRCRK